jgi:uncharacterized protein (DUF2235 family)
VKEVWFAGVHSDVGGSYQESESQLSQITLDWMVNEAESAGLRIDQKRKSDILGGQSPCVQPDPLTKNQHESLRGWWRLAEIWPKVVSAHDKQGIWRKSLRMNLGRHRRIDPTSVFHESVKLRLAASALDYKPSNLPEELNHFNHTPVSGSS